MTGKAMPMPYIIAAVVAAAAMTTAASGQRQDKSMRGSGADIPDAPLVITIDPDTVIGPVKPVNGVGQPPLIGATGDWWMFRYLSEAGIPFSRLHDVGGAYGRNIFVDIPNLFRDFDADENDPANYDFAFTDLLINQLVENGIEPFFRLGVTIENYPEVRRYRIEPPKDFAKWARICEHVIRHYTEGWADGFRHKITHWEIWNEPENLHDPEINQMWHGSFEEYCRLYEVASKHLKAAFPHLKIGGPAFSGIQAAFQENPSPRDKHRLACFHQFLKYIREHECPIDFLSYHSYDGPDELPAQLAYVREQLDAAGYQGLETSLNEWLPRPAHEKLGTALQAAEIAATLLVFQNGSLDSAAIYDARCNTGDYSPLFDPLTYKPHKAYYAFMAFNELRKRGSAVMCERGASRSSSHQNVYVTAARGEDGSIAAMLVNCGEEAVPVELIIAGDSKRTTASGQQQGRTTESGQQQGRATEMICRITDEMRTWEEVAMPSALPPYSILLVAEAAAVPEVVISNGILSAAISPRGAELRSLRLQGFEYMWQKEPDRPSGIATVLFPNCGSLFQGRYTFDGREYSMPGHGFARRRTFRAERSSDGTCATFTLESDDATRAIYPFDFSLSLAFRLEGRTLHVEAAVRNTGSETMPFAYGGHPGFNVPLDGAGEFEDWFLEFAPGTNPDAFEFGGHGLITGHTHAFPLVNGSRLPLLHELVNGPGLFLENVGSEITLRSETSPRAVTMRFPDMPYLGLWHEPGEEARYLCIEPWAGLPSYVGVPDDFATRPNMIRLSPGGGRVLQYSIEFH